ncbi:MAG: FecR domain-containing protein [Alphaproteobacteria bacterium]|nr:FecR domain-containing protein [Alphaproteobacteria bacterium]
MLSVKTWANLVAALSLVMASSIPSAALAQNIRPVSGVIAVTTAPVTINYTDPAGDLIGREGDTGDPIYLNDEIITGADSNLQILLKDQTVFTIGPDSAIVFDEFVYDPAAGLESSLTATVTKGAFKFISGKVSKSNPDAMKLKLPNATASIRGTSVAGRVRADGSSDVVLLSGAIAVATPTEPEPVDIFTSGWGMSISPAGLPSDPVQLSAADIDAIVAAVEFIAPVQTQQDTAGGSVGDDQQAAEAEPLTAEEVQAVIESASTLEEVVTAVNLALGGKGDGTIDTAELSRLFLANENLLLASNIDPELLTAENNQGVNVDAQLVQFALSGGEPKWADVRYVNGVEVLGNASSPGEYAGLISDVYAGSVSFGKTGLALTQAGEGTGSGTADYSMTVNYDSLVVSGSLSVYDVVLGGRSYDDSMDNSFSLDVRAGLNSTVLKGAVFDAADPPNNTRAASGHNDENGNGLLNMNESFEDVQVTSVNLTDSNPDHSAIVRMNASIGSIASGGNAIDGTLGGAHIFVEEVDHSASPYYTQHAISGTHYAKGTQD